MEFCHLGVEAVLILLMLTKAALLMLRSFVLYVRTMKLIELSIYINLFIIDITFTMLLTIMCHKRQEIYENKQKEQ